MKADNEADFDQLAGKAAEVHVMPCAESNREAYMAASEHVLSTVDRLIAVWDGGPSGGHGGTADVVTEALQRGLPVTIIWPDEAVRD